MSVPVAIILTDSNSRVIWVNYDFIRLTGYGLKELPDNRADILFSPSETWPDTLKKIRQKLKKEKMYRDNITAFKKSGNALNCMLAVHAIHDDYNRLTNYIAFLVNEENIHYNNVFTIMMSEEFRQFGGKFREAGIDILYAKLVNLMEEERAYLDPKLSLKKTADQLGTNTKYLSQVINQNTGSNFNYFVNGFRIQAVKDNLADPNLQNHTHFGIALKCGFRNKSTFYKVFKEVTGQTPADYIQQLQKDSD